MLRIINRTSNRLFFKKSAADRSKFVYYLGLYPHPELSIIGIFIPLYLAMYGAMIYVENLNLQMVNFLIAGHIL